MTPPPDGLEHLEGRRVAMAMSGGVDSSLAAALLVEWGCQVVGVHLKLNDLPDSEKHGKACCSLDDTLDARQACARLGIPFYVLNFVEPFRERVIGYFVESYAAGRTPNPCVMCNQHIKSTMMLAAVREFGCDFLATGHYASRRRHPGTGEWQLERPRDRRRDQTYFLIGTKREELPHLLFPLEGLEKPTVRELAQERGFLSWGKPDSQEVCFVPKDYRALLRERLPAARMEPGAFEDRAGTALGRHEGLAAYTIGQRRGLGVSGGEPYYVVALDPARNVVVLGREAELFGCAMAVGGINWVSRPPPAGPLPALVKVRYAHEGTPARIEPDGQGGARVTFAEPVRAIAPGQAAAFYEGDVLLGGGWIEAVHGGE